MENSAGEQSEIMDKLCGGYYLIGVSFSQAWPAGTMATTVEPACGFSWFTQFDTSDHVSRYLLASLFVTTL